MQLVASEVQNLKAVQLEQLCRDSIQPEVAEIKGGEKKLGKTGRLVIRKSGTEPLIRVMGEGDDADLVQAVVDEIVDAVDQVSKELADSA